MKPGDLRQFREDMIVLGATDADLWQGSTFIVLKVTPYNSGRTVDILLDGMIEEGLGYLWVESNSEALNETV